MTSQEPSLQSKKEGDSSARGRSTIEFPYLDLDSAIEVVQAVHSVGGTSCEWNQLAAQMKQAPQGGGVSSAFNDCPLFWGFELRQG